MDRDIEDTRQPKEAEKYSECSGCGALCLTDDLIPVDTCNDIWYCEECHDDFHSEDK